ncbi:hypothetical protein [Herbiconiux ginsengi]|uniref:Uncharacterized protein n=1 Tax=Herbiconiux ginsengi TaxID=381665 RepID=A0A1H3PZL7_9MICO|nr:hypothetical protein [Herbiconiux ginsengi]SDZ06381.1 hypothetical protein SAMN05216554_2201 [Herbiconiux ginsengi]
MFVPSSPHPYRQGLFDRWSGFLDGSADRASTAEYINMRIVDYGPEELIYRGLLMLNENLITSRERQSISRQRFDQWQDELAIFDEDPAL